MACLLPVGYVREPDGRVTLEPDQQVQTTTRTIFEQFPNLGSATAVLHYFRDHQLSMPRSVLGATGSAHVVWKTPTYEAIYLILTNQTYAGAYAYGRRSQVATGSPSGEPLRRRLPHEGWAVLIQDVYPAYLSCATYLDNQARLAANRSRFLPGPGSARQGQALLTGLVVCGQCGRHLGTIYNPDPWYTCTRAKLALW